jgi:hypothetical protein
MPFDIPDPPLNVAEHARNSVIRLNQRIEADVIAFVQDYEDFWGVSGIDSIDPETQERRFVSNGSLYTVAEMQAKIDAMPQHVAKSLLMLAGLKRDMIRAAEQLLGETHLPVRYRLPAFTMQPITSPTSPIVLTGLATDWTKTEVETP